MDNLILVEGTGPLAEEVKRIARNHGFDISEENQEICVIKHTGIDKIIAVIGFNSDAGTDYFDHKGQHISLEHERLYIEPQSFIDKDAQNRLDELPSMIANWVHRYLLKSAISSINHQGFQDKNTSQCFEFRINSDVDDIMQWALKKFNHDNLTSTLEILGYKNKEFS